MCHTSEEHITSICRYSWWEMTPCEGNFIGIVWRQWWLIMRTNDDLCLWRQTWRGASNNSTFDLRSFRNSPCMLYWKNKVLWGCNDMRGIKLHNVFYIFLGELLIDCFYCSDNTICLAWMICRVGKGGNKTRWQSQYQLFRQNTGCFPAPLETDKSPTITH